MTEVMGRDGTWSFDGDVIRIVPGRDRGVHKLRQLMGEITVPLTAVAGIAYEPARKGGVLALRLRTGADPFLAACGGRLSDGANPYRLAVPPDRGGVAEYFVEDVRNALLLGEVPDGPTGRFLLAAPEVPIAANAREGSVTFDGETVRIEWNWMAAENKRAGGPHRIPLTDIVGVDWRPEAGLDDGYVRFRVRGDEAQKLAPKLDPNSVILWGFKKESATIARLATAVIARVPPASGPALDGSGRGPASAIAGSSPVPQLEAASQHRPEADRGDSQDVVLARLRELGNLKNEGVLTEEEFTTAKQVLLRRL